MISLELARRLQRGGVRWDPAPGDRFVVADRDMDDEVFTLSDMTVEMHEFPGGRVIGFNGTVEWALDSIEARHALWLPSEAQLRERLGATFRSLARDPDGYVVEIEVSGRAVAARHADPAEAYGLALLHLATGELPDGAVEQLPTLS